MGEKKRTSPSTMTFHKHDIIRTASSYGVYVEPFGMETHKLRVLKRNGDFVFTVLHEDAMMLHLPFTDLDNEINALDYIRMLKELNTDAINDCLGNWECPYGEICFEGECMGT